MHPFAQAELGEGIVLVLVISEPVVSMRSSSSHCHLSGWRYSCSYDLCLAYGHTSSLLSKSWCLDHHVYMAVRCVDSKQHLWNHVISFDDMCSYGSSSKSRSCESTISFPFEVDVISSILIGKGFLSTFICFLPKISHPCSMAYWIYCWSTLQSPVLCVSELCHL